MNDTRECLFNIYCKTCKYEDVEDVEDPCNECLGEPFNLNSHKPVNYEEDAKKHKNKENKDG